MYGKLFASMYDGTLATRGPWQALVTFQQFIILKDKGGIVDMTADAIARRTTIPIEIIKIGIAALEQPDSESRSSELDGRRITLIDPSRPWGWQVVNHEKYNKIRSEEERREYMKNLMANKRAAEKKVLAHVSSCKQRLSKLAHIDVDVDIKTPLVGKSADPDGFAEFWTHYPRKVKRKDAVKAWRAINPDVDAQRAIAKGLMTQIKSPDWAKDNGKFIPHPTSWLNGRRWEDESTIEVEPESRMGKFVI